jgi:hypothetical protein
MLRKMATRAFIGAWAILSLAAAPAMAQGISRQDYSGLDKYLTQGRPDNSSFVGVRAAEFLTIPVGARGIAMGNAFTAVADDISAIWWNPAGLGFLEKKELMLTVVDYTLDLRYSYAAAAVPINDGNLVLGGFFGYLDIPEMEITTVSRPEGTGSTFNAYDFQMGASMAYNLSDRFVGGVSLKYIHQDVLGNTSGDAFAIDAGAIYHTELADRQIKFAFAIQNLGTNITMSGSNLIEAVGPEDRNGNLPSGYSDYSGDQNAFARRSNREMMWMTNTYRLPTVVKLSLAYSLYTSEKTNWVASGELWRPSYIPLSYSTGTELTYAFDSFTTASLRAGWMIQTDEVTDDTDLTGYAYHGDDPTFRGLSVGGGIQRAWMGKAISFNYAYRNKGRLSADNFFSVTLGF